MTRETGRDVLSLPCFAASWIMPSCDGWVGWMGCRIHPNTKTHELPAGSLLIPAYFPRPSKMAGLLLP